MLLCDLNIVGGHGIRHILIENGRIGSISDSSNSNPGNGFQLKFDGALAFPGLINSHDHLDFNLFPQTGNKIYRNYIEWGADIQINNKDAINSVLKIPEALRVKWGLYKNLLAGVTSVVNHGKKLPIDDDLVNVYQQSQCIHSVDRETHWKLQLNRPDKRSQKIAIHIGEGTDESSHKEIDDFIRWNLLKRPVVGVHGVAMDEKQAAAFKALVWCPSSNYFLYGKTAAVDALKHKTTMLFGTDSTLTSSWNIWEHLRQARNTGLVTDVELFDMLAVNAAKVWKLQDIAQVTERLLADIVIARPSVEVNAADSFYHLNPENILLILRRGKIMLFDARIVGQIRNTSVGVDDFSRIDVNGFEKYVRGNLPGLMREIWTYNADVVFPVSI